MLFSMNNFVTKVREYMSIDSESHVKKFHVTSMKSLHFPLIWLSFSGKAS